MNASASRAIESNVILVYFYMSKLPSSHLSEVTDVVGLVVAHYDSTHQ